MRAAGFVGQFYSKHCFAERLRPPDGLWRNLSCGGMPGRFKRSPASHGCVSSIFQRHGPTCCRAPLLTQSRHLHSVLEGLSANYPAGCSRTEAHSNVSAAHGGQPRRDGGPRALRTHRSRQGAPILTNPPLWAFLAFLTAAPIDSDSPPHPCSPEAQTKVGIPAAMARTIEVFATMRAKMNVS